MKFEYTTMPKMRRVMRDRFRDETGLRRLRVARWLDNNCNDTQLQNVFNYDTIAQAQALRIRLKNKVVKLEAWELKKAELELAELLANQEIGE